MATVTNALLWYDAGKFKTWKTSDSLVHNAQAITLGVADNQANAFKVAGPSNDYLNITTTDASEAITFGNATTNPSFSFAGSGAMSVTGTISAATGSTIGNLTLANGSITDSSGTISFGDENLVSTGTADFGATTVDSLNASSGGITNAGAISGATTVTASGAVTGGTLTDGTASITSGAASGLTTIGSSGAATLDSGGAGSSFGGDLTVTGNLIVSGDTVTVNTATLSVEDPLIELGNSNSANLVDLGLYANYNDGAAKFAGFFRDATDGVWKLYDSSTVEPTTTVDTAGNGYDHADLQLGALTVDDALTQTSGQVTFGGNVDADAGLDVSGGALTVDNQAITQTTGGQVTFAGNVDANAGLDVAGGALTVDNQAITQTTGGQVTFAGNVDADAGLDVSGANFAFTGTAGSWTMAVADSALTQTGSGQVTFTGNVDADAGLDVSGGALTIANQAITQTTGGQVTFAGNVDATAGLDVSGGALTIAAQAITQTTSGQVTFAGNVDADSGLDVSGANLTVASGIDVVPAADSTSDLGSSSSAWANLYVDTITSLDANDAVTIGDTGVAAKVSSMTSAQRDALTGSDGMLIYNTTTSQFEGYDGGWGALGAGGSVPGTDNISWEINQDNTGGDEDPFLQLTGGDGVTEKHGYLLWHAGNEEFELYADDNGTRVSTVLHLGANGETTTALDATLDFNSTTDAGGAKSATIQYLGQEDDLVIGTGAGAVSAAVNLDAESGLDVSGAAFTFTGTAGSWTMALSDSALTQTGSGQVTMTGNVDASAGLDVSGGALTIANQAITQTTGGQVTFAGNVDATNGLDVTTAALTAAAGVTISGGAVSISGTSSFDLDDASTVSANMTFDAGDLILNDGVAVAWGTGSDAQAAYADGTGWQLLFPSAHASGAGDKIQMTAQTGATGANAGGDLDFDAGAGATGSSSAGGDGGNVYITSGAGGDGAGTNQDGGSGGMIYLTPGAGGAATGSGGAGMPGSVFVGYSNMTSWTANTMVAIGGDTITSNLTGTADSSGYAGGDILAFDGTGDWTKADANTSDIIPIGIAAMAAAADATDQKLVSIAGTVMQVSTDLVGISNGTVMYLSETAGAITQTAPTTSGSTVYQVGIVVDAANDKIMWMPRFVAVNP